MRGLGFDHSGKAQQWVGQAGDIAAAFDRERPDPNAKPEKTAGGALVSGASMGMAGASAGSAIAKGASTGSAGGWWGAAIGAIIGLGAYLLS